MPRKSTFLRGTSSQSCTNSNVDLKRSRGRPRVEPQDETAAGRRRTQIRLAQRAYRSRKETTISELSERAAELRSIIAEMNESVQQLNEGAVEAGLMMLNLQHAQELQQTADRCAQLAMLSKVEPEASTEVGKTSSKRNSKANGAVRTQHNSDSARHSSASGEHIFGEAVSSHKAAVSIASDSGFFDSLSGDTDSTGQWIDNLEQDTMAVGQFKHVRASPPDLRATSPYLSDFRTQMALLSPLAETSSFAFHETSFARRLCRKVLEVGYVLCQNDTQEFRKVFKLPLLYWDRQQMSEKIKFALIRGLGNFVESPFTPFRHLGGAGKHYPPRVRGVPPKPSHRHDLHQKKTTDFEEKPAHAAIREEALMLTGYDGEWLDPRDVEGYLRERGFHIMPQASFAEGEISEEEVAAFPSKDVLDITTPMEVSISQPAEPLDLFSFSNGAMPSDARLLSTAADDVYQDSMLDWDLFNDTRFEDEAKDQALFPFGSPLLKVNTPKRRKVTVDVGKLIDSLISEAVCLGDIPAFRREAVEFAFKSAIAAY